MHRILTKDLYKAELGYELQPEDHVYGRVFVNSILEQRHLDTDFLAKII